MRGALPRGRRSERTGAGRLGAGRAGGSAEEVEEAILVKVGLVHEPTRATAASRRCGGGGGGGGGDRRCPRGGAVVVVDVICAAVGRRCRLPSGRKARRRR